VKAPSLCRHTSGLTNQKSDGSIPDKETSGFGVGGGKPVVGESSSPPSAVQLSHKLLRRSRTSGDKSDLNAQTWQIITGYSVENVSTYSGSLFVIMQLTRSNCTSMIFAGQPVDQTYGVHDIPLPWRRSSRFPSA
jgi:hypothetical protein